MIPNMTELHTLVQKKLQSRFGNGLLSSEIQYDFPIFVLKKDILKDSLKFLKEDTELNFHFLTTMCGLHYPEITRPEITRPEITNSEIKGSMLGLMYQMHNLSKNWRIRLKYFMSIEDLKVPTVSDLFPTANWMERQEYDFFGFQFVGHPNLKRILNMDEMDYFPMRKEYPLEDAGRDDKNDTMFGR